MYGSVETYDGSRCFRTDNAYAHDEVCAIYVSTNCRLNVSSFQLEMGFDYLHYGSESWTGTDGPKKWMQVHEGNAFKFVSDHSYSRSGFDICCVEETWELRGGDSEKLEKGNVYLNGQPICHHGWNTTDANLVCRSLGFHHGESTCCSHFGMLDADNFIMNHVNCTGMEDSIWACEYDDFEPVEWCNEYTGAGVECFEELEDWVGIVGTIVFLLFLICFCVICCCCFRRWKQKQKKHDVAVELEKADNSNVRNVVLTTVQPVAANNLVSDRVAGGSKTIAVVQPARESYQPKRTNTFHGYNRSSDNEGQVEGPRLNNGSIPQTNYEEPVPDYDLQTPSAPPPPAWTAPPAYAPPAYDTTS